MAFDTEYLHEECSRTFRVFTDFDPRKREKYRTPACPHCRSEKRNSRKKPKDTSRTVVKGDVQKYHEPKNHIEQMLIEQKAPATGPSMRSKAFDHTAEIVMQDYGMTNIEMNSNLRPGDSCVPKLAPELEKKVDEVFKPQGNKVMGLGGAAQLNSALKSRIDSGAFRGYGDVVQRQQDSGIRVPTQIVHEYTKQSG